MTTKMNPVVKAKWVSALRSGEYQQAKGELKCNGGFCCLGVLSDLHAKETGEGEWKTGDIISSGEVYVSKQNGKTYTEAAILVKPVQDWAGLTYMNPHVDAPDIGLEDTSVAELNDSGVTFAQIADLIEEQL